MIRITINLARQPAENLRRVRVLWGGGLAAAALLLLALSTAALVGWFGSRPIQARTDALRAQIAPLEAQVGRLRRDDAQLAFRRDLDQASFFNQLIDRKSVSWTLLFQRLEQIMPPGVELLSLHPLVRNGANAMDIRFVSNTLAPAIEFVHRLETSGEFADARVERETEAAPNAVRAAAPGTPESARFQIEVTALYRGEQ